MFTNKPNAYDKLEEKINNITAFNSATPRFGRFTGHPKLNPHESHNKPEACDPCKYSPNYRPCNTHVTGREPWTNQKILQNWARHLGFRNTNILREKKTRAASLGPAWHDIREIPKYESPCKNVGFGRTPRFQGCKDNTLGPGIYYKEHPFKAPYGPHSTRPTFEREPPCRFKVTTPSWYRGISLYTIVDPESIEMKPKKVVSRRGPYDLFTPKRTLETIISKFNTKKVSVPSWPYSLPDINETLKKSKLGLFNKSGRNSKYFGRNAAVDTYACQFRLQTPSPVAHNPYPDKKCVLNKAAFNSSDYIPRNYDPNKYDKPGVGEYDVATESKPAGNGHKHVFKSSVSRGAYDVHEAMNSF